MRSRTVLGVVAVISALIWLAVLLVGWNDYTSLSAVAGSSAYMGEKQRAALEAAFTNLLYQTLAAGVLLSAGILMLNGQDDDDSDLDADRS